MKKALYNSFTFKTIIFFAFTILYFGRVINLDQDLPPWGVAYYQPVDEGAYSMLALNEKAYGTISPGIMDEVEGQYNSYTALHLRTNIIGNVLSIISFKIFGNNYWGLRMPYVIVGYLNIILLLLILKKIACIYQATAKQYFMINVMTCGVLLCDFMYMMNSRVAETSAIRLLMMLSIFYVFIGVRNEKWKWRILGFLVVASVLFVYITDAFMVLACMLMLGITFIMFDKKKAFSCLLNFVLGCFMMYILCEVYYVYVWHTSGLLNMLKSIREFSGSNGYQITGVTMGISIKRLLRQILMFFASNVILYNLPVLAMWLLTAPVMLYYAIKKKDSNVIFIFVVIVSFLLQTIAVEDCIARKFMVIYPLFFAYFFVVYLYRKHFLDIIEYCMGKKLKVKIALLTYLVLAILFIAAAVYYRLFAIRDNTNIDFSRVDKLLILVLGMAPTVACICLVGLKIWFKRALNYKRIAIGMLMCMVFVNALFVFKYLLLNPTFKERDSMIKMARIVDGKYVVGAYQIGYTLYNDMLPVVATPENIKKIMEKNKEVLMIDYESDSIGMRQYFDEYIFKDSKYTVEPVWVIERNFQAYGSKRNMCIYRVGLKKDIYQGYREDKDTASYYPDIYSNMIGDVNNEIYVNIYGDIYGDINENVYGDIHGNIYGNVYGDIYGNVYGDVYGGLYGNVYGTIVHRKNVK